MQVLSVVQCSLEDLSGLAALPLLRELYAAYNHVASLEALMDAASLEVLDLEANDLESLDQLEFVGALAELQHLTLAHNPVAHSLEYPETALSHACASLVSLDNVPVRSLEDPALARSIISDYEEHELALILLSLKPISSLQLDGQNRGSDTRRSDHSMSARAQARPGTGLSSASKHAVSEHSAVRCAHPTR